MRIGIVGAGAWGTALAIHAQLADPGRSVSLWARDPSQLAAMRRDRRNQRYLPDVALPDRLTLALCPSLEAPSPAPWEPIWRDADLIVLATPVAALRSGLRALANCPVPLAWLCKGFEASGTGPDGARGEGGLLPHEVQSDVAPALICGALSGPSFALEVARGQPTALVAASVNERVRDALIQAFHGRSLRVYGGSDLIGVEIGGAVKNVLAIAAGLCDGMQLGLNARAALLTRGLREMTRLGVALGARADTFMGLSGLGDLVLTATGDLSRNRRVGLGLAGGQSLPQVVQALGHVAEGVHCAHAVRARARSAGVDMPICAAVVELLEGRLDPRAAVAALMARQARDE